MKRYLKHIILFLALLPLMTACVLDSDPTENCSDNEVVVSLSVSSRAVEGSQLGDGLPDDIKLWVYGQKTSTDTEDKYDRLAYINKSSKIFIGRDLYGNPVESLKQVIEDGKIYYKLHFYVVLNSGNVTSTTTDDLGKDTSISDLKAFTFTDIAKDKTDNQMIMYGYNALTIGTQTNYELSIQVERAVAKLEFFVTKENSSALLTIKKMELNKIPKKGFLTTPATTTSGLTFRDSGISYLSEETSIPDGKHLSQTEAQLGNFWQFEESRFVKMPLTQPYLMENPNGGTWTDDNNKHDYTYPTTEGYETEQGYVLTVSYQLGGSSETTTQTIYLPKIERNHLYKIYARVKDVSESLELTCIAQDWTPDDETWNYTEVVTVEKNMTWTSSNLTDTDENVTVVYEETKDDNDKILTKVPTVYIPWATSEDYAKCTFKITAPVGATWIASFETIEGAVGAFRFLNENNEQVSQMKGRVGTDTTLKIVTALSDRTETRKAKLVIGVQTLDGRIIRVDNLIAEQEITEKEFTLIQPKNN